MNIIMDTSLTSQLNNSNPTGTTSPSQDKPKTTLSSLPAELRMRIYDDLFDAPTFWPPIVITNEVHLSTGHGRNSKSLSSLATSNRRIHGEVMSTLYGTTAVDIIINEDCVFQAQEVFIGTIEEVTLWPFLRKVNLTLRFTRHGDGRRLSERLGRLILALERGRNLHSVMVRLIWGAHELIPTGIDGVIETLSGFELPGSLRVDVDGNLDKDECEEMEESIHRAILS